MADIEDIMEFFVCLMLMLGAFRYQILILEGKDSFSRETIEAHIFYVLFTSGIGYLYIM